MVSAFYPHPSTTWPWQLPQCWQTQSLQTVTAQPQVMLSA